MSEEVPLLCFDLSFNEEIQTYIPSAYLVEITEKELRYVLKNANIQVLKSYGIKPNEAEQKLLDLCKLLEIESITTKFNYKNKAKKPLSILWADKNIKQVIEAYIFRKLNIFISEISQQKLPLSLNLEKINTFGQHQILYASSVLLPLLQFVKTEQGITYTLQLTNKNKKFYPSDKQITLLLNEPGWVVINRTLYALQDINANKLNPFLNKKSIEIAPKNMKLYFEKFIKDVVKKVSIEAEGFQLKQTDTLTHCSIEPMYHLFSNNYVVQLKFQYEEVFFYSSESKKTHVNLTMDSENEFYIIQTNRNKEAENTYIQKLIQLNFIEVEKGLFSLKPLELLEKKYENIYYLIHNKSTLNELNIQVEDFEIKQRIVRSYNGVISSKMNEKTDWFDVNMEITCGEFIFSFTKLFNHLKTGNRFFELPDQSYFLIPEEWFATYKPIVEFGVTDNKMLKIQKNQYTLLNILNPQTESKEIFKHENIELKPTTQLKATLRPYQLAGAQWLWEHHQKGLGACLADDMGLGKTLQCIVLLDFYKKRLEEKKEQEPISLDLFINPQHDKKSLQTLIVCPSSLVFNWHQEFKKFAPHIIVRIHTGKDREKSSSSLIYSDITITSYSIILRDIEWFKSHRFSYLILDESQQIKNKDSKIFKAINQIETQHKISLSGTPIENSLSDLWSQMQFVNPNLLGDYKKFDHYFKKPIEKLQDELAISELKLLVKPYILRRTKEQVLQDLPPLTEQVFYSELTPPQKEIYETTKSAARNQLLTVVTQESINKLMILNTLLKLRKLSNHPVLEEKESKIESGKFNDVTLYLETLIKSKQKTLIFSSFVEHLKLYTDWCVQRDVPFALLTGGTKVENREAEINKFQENKEVNLFFISLKAGGVGLNLTKASFVLLLDPWWNPFAEKQAIGRAHRIGQEQHVNVVRFIAKDTIEEKIIKLQEKKILISDAIIDMELMPLEMINNLDYLLT